MFKSIAAAALLALASVGAASAATLSIQGGTALTLPGTFNPDTPNQVTFGPGTSFTNFVQADLPGSGLRVDGPARVTLTFLGKEAGATNASLNAAGTASLSNLDAVGSSVSYVSGGPGFLDLRFSTTIGGGQIVNGVSASNGFLDLGFTGLSDDGRSVFALFGDGGANNDNDYDDMVVRIDVAPVPVPAAGLLLGAALGGLGLLRRRQA